MKKEKRKTISSASDAKRVTEEMSRLGYAPLPSRSTVSNNNPGDYQSAMQKYMDGLLYADSKEATTGRRDLPRVFVAGGGENAVSDKVGTKGLGWMSWGAYNDLPNTVAALTELSPYTSASHKFNIDLLTGIGVEPTYRYSQYVGGNITEKEIAYRDAGTLLKGWKLDILRELSKQEAPAAAAVPVASASGSSPAPHSGSPEGSSAAAYKKALEDRLVEIEQQLQRWEKTNLEVSAFFEHNNTLQEFLFRAGDQTLLGISFPEIDVQKTYIDPDTNHEVKTFKWRPKVTAIRWRPALTCRLERMDKENKINYVYVSNQWLNNGGFNTQNVVDVNSQKIDAIRALDPMSPSDDLRSILLKTRQSNVSKNERPARFILPTRIASPLRPYYPVPPHYSIFAGRIYDYAFTMIDDRATAKQNQRVIGYVIYVHNDYLLQLYKQKECDTDEKMAKARDELFDQINTFLNNRDNMGKPLVSIMFRDADGNTAKAWEIVEIESNNKSNVEANERELQEVSSIIFFTWAVDARLIGNSPGDVKSSGGTDMRERYLLKQIQMSSTQQLLLKPYYVARDINEWDPALNFRIKREVLTTLDNSKTGITTAQDN